VLEEELLLGEVAEDPAVDPLGLDGEVVLELELEVGGVVVVPLDLEGVLSFPQPASANATAAANSSDVFIMSGPLKGWGMWRGAKQGSFPQASFYGRRCYRR
jgi:hypothetical protein